MDHFSWRMVSYIQTADLLMKFSEIFGEFGREIPQTPKKTSKPTEKKAKKVTTPTPTIQTPYLLYQGIMLEEKQSKSHLKGIF